MKILLAFVVVTLLAGVYCQTRPQISTFFDSNILLKVTIKKDNSSFRGDGYWKVDQPKGLAVEQFWFHNRSDHAAFRDLFRLQRYDLGFIYEMDDNKNCNKTSISGSMPNEWSWLANSTYRGQKLFRNRNLDLWELKVGYATVILLVDDANPNIPVFLGRETNDFIVTMEFQRFSPDHPASKWFTVPSTCQNAPNGTHHGKNVGCVARSTMMGYANDWVNDHVPYNQDGTFWGYREDCSGYVSCCWETPRPGYTTFTMPTITNPISRNDLQPGDALLCVTEHVVLFGGWVDSNNYWGYEETVPGTGTIKSSVPYPYWYNTGCFQPVRYGWVC